MKLFDKVFFSISVFFLLLIVSYLAMKDAVGAMIVSFLLTVTITVSFLHLTKRYMIKRNVPLQKVEDGLSFIGIKEQTNLFLSSLPPALRSEKKDNYILIGEKYILFPCYRFSPCTKEDVSRFYRICREEGREDAYILSRQVPRDTLLFARTLPINYRFVTTKEVRTYLKKHNLLDNVTLPKKEVKVRSRKEFFSTMLNNLTKKERARYYAVTGISLTLLGIFTPLTIYYSVFAMLSFLMAIVCCVKSMF